MFCLQKGKEKAVWNGCSAPSFLFGGFTVDGRRSGETSMAMAAMACHNFLFQVIHPSSPVEPCHFSLGPLTTTQLHVQRLLPRDGLVAGGDPESYRGAPVAGSGRKRTTVLEEAPMVPTVRPELT